MPQHAAAGPQADRHARMQREFRWHVPARFNIAEVCSGRWAHAPGASERTAIRDHSTSAGGAFHSYSELQKAADALSHALSGLGVARGDRVAIVLPQRFETAVAYIATLQMGAVALPLSMLFGPEALEHRIADSGAVCAICDDSAADSLLAARARCPALARVVGIGPAGARADLAYDDFVAGHDARFDSVDTSADDGAVLIYTSGTTGPPKGALIPHRALLGNLPGFVCSQNWFGFDPMPSIDDARRKTPSPARGRDGEGAGTYGATRGKGDRSTPVFWSPADWAWTGGLMDALLPSLYFGRAIVACRERFSADLAFELMQRHRVTHTFLFPTALKAMMKAHPRPRERFDLKLEAIMSAGEAVGDAVFDWCRDELGVVLNEMFGQTELNYIVGNCSMNGDAGSNVGWPARPGSMGRPYPGHRVALIDEDGRECAAGDSGDVAVCRRDVHGDLDPIFFLGYWNDDEATRAKYTTDEQGNEWCRTGDLALRDADGYLWYQGRADDVFKSAGYRIGPSEIENCLVKHPAVANAAVVPKPDRERGALVKAYVVLASDFVAEREAAAGARGGFDANLTAELQDHVKSRLAPYEYPKEIEFIDALPMTTTGKVQRRVLRLQEERRAREKDEEERRKPPAADPAAQPAVAARAPAATELELKLAITPEEAVRLIAHPLLLAHAAGASKTERMLAHYYDTADALLAKERIALRVRREGKAWMQTLKTASGAALALSSRGEWERPLAGPKLDWSALAGTPLSRLAGFDTLPRRVRCMFTVRFTRRSWPLTLPDGTRASASLDTGEIACDRGGSRKSEPISEFELEFVEGDPRALWKFAERLARDLNLVPLAESKGERGHALASGAKVEPRKTKMPDIEPAQGVHGALELASSAPLSALEHNLRHLDAAEIEYVHQARVALRRLRSVLRAFDGLVSDKRLKRRMEALGDPLRELGRLLGAARDADVFVEQTLPAMRKTFVAKRADAAPLAPLLDPVAASASARRDAAYREVHAWLETPASGRLLLAAERLVFEAGRSRPAKDGGRPLAAKLGALLARQHDKVQRAADALTRQSASERHRLRIEVKRLRYLLDIAQALWPKDATRDYRKALEALQEQLGELNDAAVAGETLEALQAAAALRAAWKAHERALLDDDLPRVAQAIAALDLADVPWRGSEAN